MRQIGLCRLEWCLSPISGTRNTIQSQEEKMFKRNIIAVTSAVLLICGWLFGAGVPETIKYQGMLTTPSGDAVDDGDYEVVFRIYDASSGGTVLWTSGTHTVSVSEGLFTCEIGSMVSFPDDLFATDADRWLGITVEGDPELSPRMKLTSVPYSIHTRIADTSRVGGGWVQDGDVVYLVPSVDKVGINNSSPLADLHVTHVTGTQDAFRVEQWNFLPPPSAFPLFTIKNTGQVGIGTASPAAESNLHISGAHLDIDELMSQSLVVEDVDAQIGLFSLPDGMVAGQISLAQVDAGELIDQWSILRESQNADYGGNGLRLTYGPSSNVWSNPTRMRLDADGDVGIGVDDPGNHRLYVASSNSGVAGATAFISNDNTDGIGMIVENNSPGLTMIVSQNGEHPNGEIFRCDSWTGGWHRVFGVMNSGRVICSELELTGGSDIAEPFEITGDDIPKGAVVIIDEENPGKLRMSGTAYDTRVAGIISGAGGVKPGIMLTQEKQYADQQQIAMSGRVYCLVDASYGAVKPGDLLTTSSTPGHAMKASDRERAYGAVIGKAMTGLANGQGLVLVLVSLQ
jgi:hypothetical protein